ncbi:MAG: hypothetical protein COB41_00130 [Proteobacteria bacterium]|nr:MAG: hypothetical protein COB41_00130 [Pseudomonadota bacterium]
MKLCDKSLVPISERISKLNDALKILVALNNSEFDSVKICLIKNDKSVFKFTVKDELDVTIRDLKRLLNNRANKLLF